LVVGSGWFPARATSWLAKKCLWSHRVATRPRFDWDGPDRFLLRAVHRSPSPSPGTPGPVVAESWGTLSLPYPREYLALPPDDALLQQIAALAQGQVLKDATQVLDPGDEKIRYLRALWPSLVWIALGLLLLDVLLRAAAAVWLPSAVAMSAGSIACILVTTSHAGNDLFRSSCLRRPVPPMAWRCRLSVGWFRAVRCR
jgi:hypothetical protein